MTDPRPIPKALQLPKRRTTPRESEIEHAVCLYARKRGHLAYKFTSPNRRSVPDRLFVSPSGFVYFVEFKAAGKKPTEAQHREIARLRGQGCRVYVIDNIDDGKRVVEAFR